MTMQIKGPGLFLAQFPGDKAPYDTLAGIAGWAAGLGYKRVQIPTFVPALFDLDRAAVDLEPHAGRRRVGDHATTSASARRTSVRTTSER